jgi:hypothetical protein
MQSRWAHALGTNQDIKAMIYYFNFAKTRGGGIKSMGGVIENNRLRPVFCAPNEVNEEVTRRWNEGAIEVRVLPVDKIIEDLATRVRQFGVEGVVS